ncbi:MAG: glycosyltransferase family 4 protein [Phycisphaerae bacterium]|jgi:glycosyltransferase involved in cell wall biosynthesis
MQLALFFTRGVSLKLWLEAGLFDREKQLYEELLRGEHLKKVYWLTYGKDDAAAADELKAAGRLHPDIVVLPMPPFLPGWWGGLFYSFLMPLFCRRWLKSANIFKTNQMDGSWAVVLAKWLYRKPLVVRTGYTWSLLKKKHCASEYKQKLIALIERFAYKNAAIAVVTSEMQAQYISERYSIPEKSIKVIPNYINTQLFTPQKSVEKYSDRLIFVGRLNEEKNLFNLIEAVAQAGMILDIYGQGSIRNKLEALVKKLNAKVNFMGVVPNNELPGILNRYRYSILSSFYEGMPKTLLEAMACGLVCIGTDVEGINNIIEDGVNGYLAKGTQAQALVEAIKRAVRLPNDSITAEGLRQVRSSFSLETAVEREKEIIANLKI